MARIKSMDELRLQRPGVHSEVEATYTVFLDGDGNAVLQIDTYGSKERKMVGKKSQSVQFGQAGLEQSGKIPAEASC